MRRDYFTAPARQISQFKTVAFVARSGVDDARDRAGSVRGCGPDGNSVTTNGRSQLHVLERPSVERYLNHASVTNWTCRGSAGARLIRRSSMAFISTKTVEAPIRTAPTAV